MQLSRKKRVKLKRIYDEKLDSLIPLYGHFLSHQFDTSFFLKFKNRRRKPGEILVGFVTAINQVFELARNLPKLEHDKYCIESAAKKYALCKLLQSVGCEKRIYGHFATTILSNSHHAHYTRKSISWWRIDW